MRQRNYRLFAVVNRNLRSGIIFSLSPAAEQNHNKSRHGFLAKFGAVIEPNLIYSYHNRKCGSSCVSHLANYPYSGCSL